MNLPGTMRKWYKEMMRINVLKAAIIKQSGFKQWWMNNFLFSWPLSLWRSRCDILLEISGKVIVVDFSNFLSKNLQNSLQFSSVMLWGYCSIICTRYCRMPSHPRGSVIEPTEKLSDFFSKDRTSLKQKLAQRIIGEMKVITDAAKIKCYLPPARIHAEG